MNAEQVAQSFARARRVGKGKWMALCPAHPDRNRSLSIAEGKRVPVVLKCMSHGCDTKTILGAIGLTWAALFDGKPPPEIRRRVGLREAKEVLERQLGLVIILGAIEKEKRSYWAAAERRIRSELSDLRCQLEPEKVIEEWRKRCFQQKLQQLGWDGLWEELNGRK